MSEELRGGGPGGTGGAQERPDTADQQIADLLRTRVSRPAAPLALRARIEAALAAEIEAIGRSGAGAGSAVPAPPALPGTARPGIRRPSRPARPTAAAVRQVPRRAPALAAGLGALLLAGVSTGLWLGYPAVERRLAADAVRSAVREYRRLEAAGPVEPVQSPAELSARLSAALGVPVRLAEPKAPGVRLAGAAPTSLFGAPGMAVFVEVDGRLATLSLVPSQQTMPRDGQVRLGRRRLFMAGGGGERVIIWRQGPLICTLAGEFPEPRLTALFLVIRPGLEVGGA